MKRYKSEALTEARRGAGGKYFNPQPSECFFYFVNIAMTKECIFAFRLKHWGNWFDLKELDTNVNRMNLRFNELIVGNIFRRQKYEI